MDNYTEKFFSFIKEHINDDVHSLLLKKNKDASFNYNFAIEQIESRKKLRHKLPSWNENFKLIFPSKLAYEQASSETTARYKQHLIKGSSVCDLTGGLGIDSFFLSQVAEHSAYIEINEKYCKIAAHNFSELGASSIQIINDSCEHYINTTNLCFDTYYIDPARRNIENKRLYALSDCEPDILKIKDTILKKGQRLIIKASPMLDIDASLQLLENVSEIHILSIKNECKELLFVIDREAIENDPLLVCVNFVTDKEKQIYSYRLSEEKESSPTIGDNLQFLYEPNASIMKAGAFKSVSLRYNANKLHTNSHLYTSALKICDFPGRVFEIIESFDFSKKSISLISRKYQEANISTRNFPLSADGLRKKLKIKEGGNIYIFATTLSTNKKLIICKKATF